MCLYGIKSRMVDVLQPRLLEEVRNAPSIATLKIQFSCGFDALHLGLAREAEGLRPGYLRAIYCQTRSQHNRCAGVSLMESDMRIAADQSTEGFQVGVTNPAAGAGLSVHYLARALADLLEKAQRELDNDHEAARASLAAASSILRSEIERSSGANGTKPGALANWQMVRVRAFIEANLHSSICIRDLSMVARRSPAYFSRSFKQAFGEPPHAYLMKRRLERACHLMVTTSESLSDIALSAGFSDQAHLCRFFQRAFSQTPSVWRRHHTIRVSISNSGLERTALGSQRYSKSACAS
jgi:AraC family transcriptional regulator